MTVFLIILAALVVVGGVLWALHPADAEPVNEPGDTCCGQHMVCERDSLLAAVSQEVEYFDDEELDRFAGREADSYQPDEVEAFRDVLLTLQPDDVAPWARSIQLRGIELPVAVRDELILIVEEVRGKR
jgi:hypothetical protein